MWDDEGILHASHSLGVIRIIVLVRKCCVGAPGIVSGLGVELAMFVRYYVGLLLHVCSFGSALNGAYWLSGFLNPRLIYVIPAGHRLQNQVTEVIHYADWGFAVGVHSKNRETYGVHFP